jgi:hypothetical protein
MPKQAGQKSGSLLFPVIAALPPSIVFFHLFTVNYMEISFIHVLIADAVFTLLTLAFYLIVACAAKKRFPEGFAALLTAVCWVISVAAFPVYRILVKFLAARSLRYICIILLSWAALAAVVLFLRRLRGKAVFILAAVFETVIFALNFVPSMALFLTNSDGHSLKKTISERDFTVDPQTPSPNIYWVFMDGMLGFQGMETLFNDSQREFTASLEERGFVINRNAEFESLHATIRATPSLFCPNWYDAIFAPLLNSVDLSNYAAKMKIKINTTPARTNNELITALAAKGYTASLIVLLEVNRHLGMAASIQRMYYARGAVSNGAANNADMQKLLAMNLNMLFSNVFAPWKPLYIYIDKLFRNSSYVNGQASGIQKELYGEAYAKNPTLRDTWYPDALYEVCRNPAPRFVVIYDAKAHAPFHLNDDGSVKASSANKNSPNEYPSTHRFAAKMVIAYCDLILGYDPEAVIVVQADHGLHMKDTHKLMLAEGWTEDEIRIAQNQTMSAVRIPEKWGGLEGPIDPLNITRLLVNRYVGENYEYLEAHP